MANLRIRPARADEAPALTELCLRSKAHWGYDDDFMRASRPALTIAPEMIAEGRVLVAETSNGVVGVATAALIDASGVYDLGHMFVSPDAIRTGAGRALFEAILALVRDKGGKRLVIVADPNAEEFYRRLGAKRIGDAPSDSIPGRFLPLLEYKIG
jgi:GNAT superfamily N-acetyltransferase